MIPMQTALAAIRFGTGLNPDQAPPLGPEDLMRQLDAAPPQLGLPLDGVKARIGAVTAIREARRSMREAGMEEPSDALRTARQELNAIVTRDHMRKLGRLILSPHGLQERLVLFWGDHFTVEAQGPQLTVAVEHFQETAIRPHIGGRFADMLTAAVRHPAMLQYLNQRGSVGPNSPAGERRNRGLNENLAREVLELHTLGVGGGYTQTDVREFAELLTGYTVGPDGFVFRPQVAEPGAETVLGTRYGGGEPAAADAARALEDLAMHPATAGHLARKLALHFVGPDAPEALIGRMATAYLESGGELPPMYRALLIDPWAWEMPLRKAKPPLDFIVSAVRALGQDAQPLLQANRAQMNRAVLRPLAEMGQPLNDPAGPDGWPEAPEAWITPAGLAARTSWASAFAREYAPGRDPRALVEQALGPLASDMLMRAVAGAETRAEGVTVALASPEFNRR